MTASDRTQSSRRTTSPLTVSRRRRSQRLSPTHLPGPIVSCRPPRFAPRDVASFRRPTPVETKKTRTGAAARSSTSRKPCARPRAIARRAPEPCASRSEDTPRTERTRPLPRKKCQGRAGVKRRVSRRTPREPREPTRRRRRRRRRRFSSPSRRDTRRARLAASPASKAP